MSYLVLARKWRPMSFSDLVGQEHVSRTLASAIASGRIAHAFLFTGVRGVGKTTSARILAKALNCLGDPESGKEPGPTIEPCLKCAACVEITNGTDIDVREIDGASYNGVEEVRKLQDSLPYRPTRDRYKIIIVDEVHMLSSAAWNAFLKTLEEPPAHVKFVFATTEVHKVPVTILSRVQRFDFKLIPARTIAERLRYVLGQEGVTFDEQAVSILAQKAAGSMRDGMSLLDQVIAFGGDTLRGEDVAQVLGVASRTALIELCRALVRGDAQGCLSIVAGVAEQGLDLVQLARDLLAVLRHLVVARIAKNPAELIDLPDEERLEIEAIAKDGQEADLLRLHNGFSKGFDEVSRGADPRASLEMLLARLALRPPLLPIDELLVRLGALEKRLASGRGASAPALTGAAPKPAPAKAQVPAARGREPHAAARASAPIEASDEDPDPAPPPVDGTRVESAPPVRAEPEALPAISADTLERTLALLPACDSLRQEDAQLASYVEQTEVLSSNGALIRLGIQEGFLFERELTTHAATAKIHAHLAAVLGEGVRLEFGKGDVGSSIGSVRALLKQQRRQAQIDELRNHPRVKQAVQVLGARIRQVVLPE